jgi:hypothetical protein
MTSSDIDIFLLAASWIGFLWCLGVSAYVLSDDLSAFVDSRLSNFRLRICRMVQKHAVL